VCSGAAFTAGEVWYYRAAKAQELAQSDELPTPEEIAYQKIHRGDIFAILPINTPGFGEMSCHWPLGFTKMPTKLLS
jgi:hypothetical protein